MTGPVSVERSAALRHVQRASGQVAALASMIAAGQPFPEVARQLLAARGSLDSLLARLVELELCDCVPSREARDEVHGLLRTALGRSAPARFMTRTRRRGPGSSSVGVEERTSQ